MADVLYFDDNKRPIATTDAELLIYFKSIGGTTAAANVPFLLSCPMISLLQITSSGKLPKFIYKGGTAPANKIYLRQLGSGTSIENLCNGVNSYSIVPIPVIGTISSISVIVPVPVIGTIISGNATVYPVTFTGDNGWTEDPSYTSGKDIYGVVTLNISVSNPAYNSVGPKDVFTNEWIGTVGTNGKPTYGLTISSLDNPNLPAGSSITFTNTGQVLYSGEPSFEDGTGSIIELFGIKYNIT